MSAGSPRLDRAPNLVTFIIIVESPAVYVKMLVYSSFAWSFPVIITIYYMTVLIPY
jgi:hypothetical protein